LGYTQAVDVKLIADSQDNRKGHHGEDNNIYLNDANLNNTKDLATIGQKMGELRNEIGLTSHGKSLEEIKQRNNNVDSLTSCPQFYGVTGTNLFAHRFQQGFGIFQ
jgi:hypothetical protein